MLIAISMILIRHMKSVLLLHSVLDLLISNFGFRICQIQLVHIHHNIDVMLYILCIIFSIRIWQSIT